MRAGGINWLAVIAAAVAIYAIGFVIYGLLIPAEGWMAMSGISEAEMKAVGQSRMPFSVVMPLMTAVFMAVLFKWGSVAGRQQGRAMGHGCRTGFGSADVALWLGLWRRTDRNDRDRQRPPPVRPYRRRRDPWRLEIAADGAG